ncbi:MAG: hypothetical protein V1871_08350 [Planctomycetota bacterium]
MSNKILIFVAVLVVLVIIGVLGISYYYQAITPQQNIEIIPQPPSPKQPTDPPELISLTNTSEAVVTKTEVVDGQINLEFQLKSSTVIPGFKSAVISNTLTNTEKICQEGNFLDSQKYGRWTLFDIGASEVALHQYYSDGSVEKEYTLKLAEKSDNQKPSGILRLFKPGEKKVEPIKNGGFTIPTPADIDKVISGTSVNAVIGLIRLIPDALIKSFVNTLPQEYVRNKLEESFGLAISEETFKNCKPTEVVLILHKVADDFTPKGEKSLLFSVQVNPDFSPISPTTTFRPNTKRIYACFKNEGVLAKLDKVIIKWTNQTNKNIIYWNVFMLNPDANYNHIWVQLENWDVGKYLVSIYKQIQDVEPVACGEFEIK